MSSPIDSESEPPLGEISLLRKGSTSGASLSELIQSPRHFPWEDDFVPLTLTAQNSVNLDAEVKFSQLCFLCAELRSWMQRKINLETSDEKAQQPHKDYIISHYSTGIELKESARKGCHLCTLIFYNLVNNSVPYHHDRSLYSDEVRDISIRTEYFDNGENPYRSHFDIIPTTELGIGDSMRVGTIKDVYLNPETVRQSIYTASSAFWDISKTWIQDCDSSHDCHGCAADDQGTLPSRLIDLQSPDLPNDLRLVETNTGLFNRHVRYVTLSYCWGGNTGFRLQKSTIRSMYSGFSSKSLPKTIQDAIIVARRFDVKYIWVDSLCILQDSTTDWNKEARRMGDVYRHGYLSIAALSARNSSEGLFSQRDPLKRSPCRIFQFKIGDYAFVNPLRFQNQREHIQDSYAKAPLHSRAWVMQERLLAPRTLNFGESVFWECRQGFQHEFTLVPSSLSLRSRELGLINPKSALLSSSKIFKNDTSTLHFWAEKIIPIYSVSKLTVKTDRLVALQGIIQEFYRKTGWQNLMGLWRPFLLEQCLWRLELTYEAIQESPLESRIYDIPTWSWASVGSQVHYPKMPVVPEFFKAEISPCRIGQPGQEIMGLVISSFLLEIASNSSKSNKKWTDYQYVRLKDERYGFFLGRCVFDTIVKMPIAYANYHFLPLMGVAQVNCPVRLAAMRPYDSEDMDEASGVVRGLVVTKSSRYGITRYERAGFLTMPAWQLKAWRVGVHFEEIIKSRRLGRITVI